VVPEGGTSPLKAADVPSAAFADARPSVGIGVRRESDLGPHLGCGIVGKYTVTGDLQRDRAAVEQVLEQLLEQTKRGDLDDILQARSNASGSG
jgi:hypothetical protein